MSKGRILALDPGTKRVGAALSDPLGITAQPAGVLDASDPKELVEEVARIVEEKEVKKVIVGTPRSLAGGHTESTTAAEELCRRLRERLEVPVEAADERLTSVMAGRILSGAKRKIKHKKGTRDVIAAQLILQSYLDRMNAHG